MADTGQERGNAGDAANAAAADDSSPDHHHLEESMAELRVSDGPDKVNSAAHNAYPDRPGEPDCSYYMRTGMCAYGTNCRYNHPTYIGQDSQYTGDLPQREGQPECQFFLKTGTCRYGSTCKYHHPREKINTRPIYFNSCGLPIREGEKPCPYYMKTGYCKFSVACKFSHPELGGPSSGMLFPVHGSAYQTGNGSTQVVPPAGGLPLVGGFPAWPISRAAPYMMSPTPPRVQGMPPYGPLVLQTNPNSQPVQPTWPTYMQGNATQADVLPGGNNNQMPGAIINQTPSSSSSNSAMNLNNNNNLPERLDQPDCQHYLKTGSCKYGASCKYNHPKERNSLAQAQAMNAAGIGPLGLPLRPGQQVCSFYSMYGTCKYGTGCKYDHPVMGYYNYPVPAYSLPDPYAPYTDQRNSQLLLTMPPPEALGLGFHDEQNNDTPSETPQVQIGPSDHQN